MVFSLDLRFLICFGGIFFSYLIYGILQENVYVTEYGPNKERFKFTLFAVLAQSVMGALVARLVMAVLPRSEANNNTGESLQSYFWSSTSQTFALICSNYALQFIDYPTQVIAKSCKPLPIMVGDMLTGTPQPLRKYVFVLLITGGIALFTLQDTRNARHKVTPVNEWSGLALVLVSLLLDGVTGKLQDRLIAAHHPSSYRMMYSANLWSALLGTCLLTLAGEWGPVFAFIARYPIVLVDIVIFSLVSAVGQTFIYYTVKHYGSLLCAIVTTSRKFFTVLASVFYYAHPLTQWQWGAVLMVFAGLGLDTFYSKKDKHSKKTA
jgi:UDP-galactose transporter B1